MQKQANEENESITEVEFHAYLDGNYSYKYFEFFSRLSDMLSIKRSVGDATAVT